MISLFAFSVIISIVIVSNMYVAAGDYMKAVMIMGDNGWVER